MRGFRIRARWNARSETPEEIAPRLKLFISMLRKITPQYRQWFYAISDDNRPEVDETENWLVSAIGADVFTDDLGAPVPNFGYFVIILNSPPRSQPQADDVFIEIDIGGDRTSHAALKTFHDLDLDPALVSYSVVKRVVLAFSRAFEPCWCEAGLSSLNDHLHLSDYKEGPVLTPCWMIHLSPPLAARITPPPDVTTERFADGSLFLSVTEQTFDPDNGEHVAAALRLFAILDPLQEKRLREQWRR